MSPCAECCLTTEDVAYVRSRYEARIAQEGVTWNTLHCGGPEKERSRYAAHSTALESADASVLDIGCGLGGLYAHLKDRGFRGRYTGMDIVPAYVEKCRIAYPEASFELNNPFGGGIRDEYDTIVMCQALNTRLPVSSNFDVMAFALEQAFKRARYSVSFDMLSTYVDYQDPDLFYYAPEDILAVGKQLTRWVAIRHDYRPYEFCIQLFHHAREMT